MSEQSVITATYLVETDQPQAALTALCRGQSVGNPAILTPYETKAFLDKWAATGKFGREAEGLVGMTIKFPSHNFGNEGVNYLLSVLMGGQCDVDLIQGCRLIDLDLGAFPRRWARPWYGVAGVRDRLRIPHRALVGGILKPKIGLTPQQVADVARQMAEGGCDLIKEDEILADQHWCSMEKRLPLVSHALQGFNVLYFACVTADGSAAWVRARKAQRLGATGIHLNLWCGLGTYRDVREHVEVPMHFQKSGDKVWTTGPFSIDAAVLCQLVNLIGCDTAHVGMYGGYLAEGMEVLKRRMKALRTTLPTFSCGMTPALAEQIIHTFGTDLAVFSGGWIHGDGHVTERCQQLRRTVDAASQAVAV